MVRAIYPRRLLAGIGLPDSVRARTWQRTDAIRELVRGVWRFAGQLLPEIWGGRSFYNAANRAALRALEAEGFVLRGKFHPQALTRNGAIADCWREFTGSPSIACAQRFSRSRFTILSFSFRVAPVDREHRAESLQGLQSVLEQLDGCSCHWRRGNRRCYPARVADYDPEWARPALFFWSSWFGDV